MPVSTPEAIQRKEDNRKSKKDIAREDKIKNLGGKPLSITYGQPLTTKEREYRTEYLYDLMYPQRHKKKQKNRVYLTEEEKRVRAAEYSKNKYREAKGGNVREHTSSGKPWHSRTPWAKIYYSAKNRAKTKGIPFDITLQDVEDLWVEHCPILGIELSTENEVLSDNSPTLDKNIPELGYVKGNITIISNLANRIKSNATPSQVMKVALWMKRGC